jgi:membrane protein YdbS with pleckstrin-like domain
MYEPLRRRALTLLKVPPEPHPPTGDPASLRVFRAGRNYLRLRLAGWAFTQIIALAAIIFWTAMLIEVESRAHAQPPADQARASVNETHPDGSDNVRREPWPDRVAKRLKAAAESPDQSSAGKGRHFNGWAAYKQMLVEIALVLPAWAFPLVWTLKIFGFVVYLVQIPITYAVRRLDYEMRWYMVTDRSLRLRHGVWKVSESTMSFANLQQVVVTQGPLQRLLGLADVRVQSAGGGGGRDNQQHHGEDMHLGLFHSVTNAPEIRDLILDRLRRFRETGLGDPDETPSAPSPVIGNAPTDTLAAARELVAEARALRAALT